MHFPHSHHVVDTYTIIPTDIKPNAILNPPNPPIHSEQDKHQEDTFVIHQGSKEKSPRSQPKISGTKLTSKSSPVQGTNDNTDNECITPSSALPT